mgnify:CR=1 FL=1
MQKAVHSGLPFVVQKMKIWRFIMADQNPIVTFTMENGDTMKAELYPEVAPNTVNNFISLVKKGFYAVSYTHLRAHET